MVPYENYHVFARLNTQLKVLLAERLKARRMLLFSAADKSRDARRVIVRRMNTPRQTTRLMIVHAYCRTIHTPFRQRHFILDKHFA